MYHPHQAGRLIARGFFVICAILIVLGSASAAATIPATPIGWRLATLPPNVGARNLSLAIFAGDAHTVIAWNDYSSNVWRSTDAGLHWTRVGDANFTGIHDVVIDALDPQQLLALQYSDLVRSADAGHTWAKLANPPLAASHLVSDPYRSAVYAVGPLASGGGDRVSRSVDHGASWSTPSAEVPSYFNQITTTPAHPDRVYATFFHDVLRSDDDGTTWTSIGARVGDPYNPRLLADAADPGTLYLGHENGLRRSLDDGDTWQDSATSDRYSQLALYPQSTNLIGALVDSGHTANSRSWVLQTTPTSGNWALTQFGGAPADVQKLAQAGRDQSLVYVVTGTQLWTLAGVPGPLHNVWLPVLSSIPGSQVVPTDDSSVAVARLNLYRARLGVAPVTVHPAITQATAAHANYYVTNSANAAAEANGPHSRYW